MNVETFLTSVRQTKSLKAVADINGIVINTVTYESFGLIVHNFNPAFDVPFRFAGGLHDVDTILVRFGFSDYKPVIGR